MKAKITITSGAARIYPAGPKTGEVHEAPYSVELEGSWGVGSGSAPGAKAEPATVTVLPAEDGVLRHYLPAHDSFGAAVQSGTWAEVKATAGVELSFQTHESNAVTIAPEAVAEPKNA